MKFITTVVTLVAIVVLTKAGHIKNNFPVFLEPAGPAEITTDNRYNVKTKWIIQPLDHFDAWNTRTWYMRYLVNEEHFKNGGPIFILVGGYAPITAGIIQSGILVDLVKEHKGILFYIEHRYYGKSNPTSDLSTENLKYLHTKQALEDLALFIRTQRANDSRLANSKVIIAGGSYAGSLVIWFSNLYPELMNGGWASSAPILAQVDFKEFNEMSGKAYRDLGSQQCYNRIQNGIAELEAMFENHRWAEAKAMLLLCDAFNHKSEADLGTLFFLVTEAFTDNVLFQRGADMHNSCNYIMSFEDDLTAVVAVFMVKHFVGQECIDLTYGSGTALAMNLSLRSGNPRPWYYQLCNEFGWFQTTTSREQPFGTRVHIDLLTKVCYNAFGSKYTNEHIHELVAETNRFLGGLQPGLRNVYVTHGALDPWSPLGLNETHGASVIPHSSHCSDFGSISSLDSPEMRASKQRLVNSIREWLA